MPPSPASAAASPSPRIPALDALRGVALLAMIVVHASWDLAAFGVIDPALPSDPAWIAIARGVAATFLALVGVGLVLAARQGTTTRHALARIARIAAAAGLVSLASYAVDAGQPILFGILHCIALASLIAWPLRHAVSWLLVVLAVAALAAPGLLASPTFDSLAWYWLGLSTEVPPAPDYVPLLPWGGVVLLGILGGRLALPWLVRDGAAPAGRATRLLAWPGRHSLAIYLLHQPLLLGLLTLAAPRPVALEAAWTASFQADCRKAGEAEAVCAAYARCAVTRLRDEPGLLRAAGRKMLTDAQRDRWHEATEACEAETAPARP